MSNAPAKKIRIGYVTATIWRNEGTERPFFSVELARTYKDEDGTLKNTSALGHADLLNAAHLLSQSADWIAAQ